jgi:hypothetical protein
LYKSWIHTLLGHRWQPAQARKGTFNWKFKQPKVDRALTVQAILTGRREIGAESRQHYIELWVQEKLDTMVAITNIPTGAAVPTSSSRIRGTLCDNRPHGAQVLRNEPGGPRHGS